MTSSFSQKDTDKTITGLTKMCHKDNPSDTINYWAVDPRLKLRIKLMKESKHRKHLMNRWNIESKERYLTSVTMSWNPKNTSNLIRSVNFENLITVYYSKSPKVFMTQGRPDPWYNVSKLYNHLSVSAKRSLPRI